MVLELLEKLVPYGIGLIILFFLWLAIRNRNRLHKIKHTGRISEIIDRRRNFIFYIVLCIALFIYLIIYLFQNHSSY